MTRDVDVGSISLEAAAKLAGRVAYPDGRAVAGVEVTASIVGPPTNGGVTLAALPGGAPLKALAGSVEGRARTFLLMRSSLSPQGEVFDHEVSFHTLPRNARQ